MSCPRGKYSNQTKAFSCAYCEAGKYSIISGATSQDACLTCPVGTPCSITEDVPNCGYSPDCIPSVLLRGNKYLDTAYFSSASWPLLNSDGGVKFSGSDSQFLNAGPRVFDPLGYVGFTATVVFQYTGASPGNNEKLFDLGNGAPLDNILLGRSGSGTSLYHAVYNGASGNTYASTNTLLQSTIYIMSVAFNPENASHVFYFNGFQSQTVANPNASALLSARLLNYTYIGRSLWGSDAYFTGIIYYLGIYNRLLSKNDILLQHQCAATCTLCSLGYYCPLENAPIWHVW
jgi:hypothetical protein